MKKLLALLLCLSLVFALAACSTSESPAQQPSEQPTQTDNQPEEPVEQTEQPSEPETPAYPIEQFTVGTTAAIETATFGEYNFDMLASGVSELPLVWGRTPRATIIRCWLPTKRKIPSHGSTPLSRA